MLGEESMQITAEHLSQFARFLLSLPVGSPTPDIALEADGEIDCEWYSTTDMVVAVSVSPTGLLSWAGLIDGAQMCGVVETPDATRDSGLLHAIVAVHKAMLATQSSKG